MRPVLHNPSFPKTADPAAAERLCTNFAALGKREAAFAATPQGAAVLAALGGNAPYLADLACAEPETLISCLESGPCPEAILATLDAVPPTITRSRLCVLLRQAKRQMALRIALADLSGAWTLEQVTSTLSALAVATLRATLRHLLRALHDEGAIHLPTPDDPEMGSGFVALALGKLAAGELNYSSDIDLVLLYDPDAGPYPPDSQSLMARLARDLTTILSARDENGYVFRVDLRLRPNPAATPPVVSLAGALAYYESQGRTWERAAFSKARPVAGDLVLGQAFLNAIKPFIWRKYLDFAAISDIHEMKRQIDAHHTNKGLLGFDVKLGQGGIREIEFIVQTLGLIWGGHNPALRIPATLAALPVMAQAGHLDAQTAHDLAQAYRTLRKVEHRLQMVADHQTHTLPSTDAALDKFCIFLDEPDFRRAFPRLLARVHAQFLAFFSTDEPCAADLFNPGRTGAPPDAFTARLEAMGFKDTRHIANRLRDWTSGTLPALRSPRARDLLETILPTLFAELGALPEPDKAFIQFDTMLCRQPAGVQLLSLFAHNTALLKRLAAVLGAAPALSDYLSEAPQALEGLLDPQARFAAPRPVLGRLLAEAEDLEQAATVTRRFVRQEEFHLSVATLEGRLNADEAGVLRSHLAAASLSRLLPFVLKAHRERLGSLPRAKLAIVALGKAGSGEMLAGSDLDLMLIYDHPPASIAPTHWFVRFSHSFVGTLTAQGRGGALYPVDMRLRPSGNAGPVAVSLASFNSYHAHESWTWERLALTRARVLAATPGFAPVVREAITTALCRADAPGKILADTAAMRARLAAEIKPLGPFDVRNTQGGMMEVGFIAQALQLVHGPHSRALFHPNTKAAFKALARAGHLRADEARLLIRADFLWRSLQGLNRITGLSEKATTPSEAMLAPLYRVCQVETYEALRQMMAATATAAHDIFNTRIIKGARL